MPSPVATTFVVIAAICVMAVCGFYVATHLTCVDLPFIKGCVVTR